MKLKKIGMISSVLICASLNAMPAFADLTIINGTDKASTSRINGGFCSTVLGPIGITEPNTTSVIKKATVDGACWINRTQCKAEVFMTRDCSGTPIATVVLNTETGIVPIDVVSGSYHLIGSGFQISLQKA